MAFPRGTGGVREESGPGAGGPPRRDQRPSGSVHDLANWYNPSFWVRGPARYDQKGGSLLEGRKEPRHGRPTAHHLHVGYDTLRLVAGQPVPRPRLALASGAPAV